MELTIEMGIKFLTSNPYHKLDKKAHRQKAKKLAYNFESRNLGLQNFSQRSHQQLQLFNLHLVMV